MRLTGGGIGARKAIIVGSGGQDGYFLNALLENRGYTVLGVTRSSLDITQRIAVDDLVASFEPSEIYLLAAHHHSAESSFDSDDVLFERSQAVHTTATINFLEAVARLKGNTRLFFASSSHIFADAGLRLLDESSAVSPNSIYAITKFAGMLACRYYRENRGVFASCGILFNHESNLRKPHFLSRKITMAAARISRGESDSLELGNLDAIVDWGYAPDFVDAMYQILQADIPSDYIVATGIPHTVREFVDIAFSEVGLDYRGHVIARPNLLTKHVETRLGNAGRLRQQTAWKTTIEFDQMVRRMVRHELDSGAANIRETR